jgi:hypothetical protein
MKRALSILALGLAASLLVAGLVSACEGHSKATASKASAGKEGCVKAAQASASGCSKAAGATATTASHAGCSKATAATATTVSTSGCSKAAGATATAASTAGCSKAAAGVTATTASTSGCSKAAGTSACCKKGAAPTATIAAAAECRQYRPGHVALKGTVHCGRCDLAKTVGCATMFRTADGCLFRVHDGDKTDTLREQAGHGSKLVRVRGMISQTGELNLASFRILGDTEAAGL